MSGTESVQFFARPSLRRVYFYAFIYAGLVVAGRYATNLNPSYNSVWAFCLALMLVLLGYAHLRRICTSYIITDRQVQVREGILSRRLSVIPLGRITNVAARQSFLERILGLVILDVDSAGTDLSEITFRRITKRDAQAAGAIVQRIIEQNHNRVGGSVPPFAEEGEPRVVGM